MRVVIDTDNILEWVKKKWNGGVTESKYGDFPAIPDEIELKGLRRVFATSGKEFITKWELEGYVTPNSRILDIGCGNGRIAMPITEYLQDGEYYGQDISKERIDWLKENVTKKFPNVKFVYSDLYNKMYNKDGKLKASEYRFPFEENTFDFIFLWSVFTHMLPEDVENYLNEIYRVLRKGGKCMISYFLIDTYNPKLLEENQCSREFPSDQGDYRVKNPERHESAVGYKERFIENLYREAGFGNKISIKYGLWRNTQIPSGAHDIIIAEK